MSLTIKAEIRSDLISKYFNNYNIKEKAYPNL